MDLRTRTSLFCGALALAIAVSMLLRRRPRRAQWFFAAFSADIGLWYVAQWLYLVQLSPIWLLLPGLQGDAQILVLQAQLLELPLDLPGALVGDLHLIVQVRAQALHLLVQLPPPAPGVKGHHTGGDEAQPEAIGKRRQLARIHDVS